MKLVFRVNYRTRPGQSLWLKLAALFTANGARVAEVLPLRWLNPEQWEGTVELDGSGPLRLEYHYQLRQEANGVEFDEWLAPRVMQVDPAVRDVVVALDTWCSAGTVDYVYETSALAPLLPARGPFAVPAWPREANHEFNLHLAAVPPGRVACLIGSAPELGGWDRQRALQLVEISANTWQLAVSLPADGHVEYKYGRWDVANRRVVALEEGPNRVLGGHAFGSRQWTRVADEAYARAPEEKFRGCGVAVPVFSLRSAAGLGVGEFADLKPLADWAAVTGLRMIQILPVNDTTAAHAWTDSYPYSAISVFALHPLYLRLDELPYPMPREFAAELAAAREALNPLPEVDYEAVMRSKRQLTRQVYDRHQATLLADPGFRRFYRANRSWLVPYAAFCFLRDREQTADFSRWGEWAAYDPERVGALADESGAEWPELGYHLWLQFELDRQLAAAVRHLRERGIVLKGDLPIGINRQSVDAWMQPRLFNLESQAGAPPDAFSLKGQNWGFPTYDWEAMKADGYAWWRARFAHLSRYFGAFRIDHILGFFRIWQIPNEQVEGIMGWFEPALPIHVDELRSRGIPFDFNRFCRPYIREHSLVDRFGAEVDRVRHEYLEPCGFGYWKLRDGVATQRRIVEVMAAATAPGAPERERYLAIRQALMDCVSEVLLIEVPGSQGTWFHPRCLLHLTQSYQELDDDVKWRLSALHDDYFYRRQEDFWEARGYEKLPAMRQASPMLLCGEDLGMVPACVPGVMAQLGILSLDIQRMPKNPQTAFFNPAEAPYLSVVSPSTHDMAGLRGWWREDGKVTSDFAWSVLGVAFPPLDLTGELAARIIARHLQSPALWAVLPLQDLLAMDETLRHPDPEAERINVPAITPYYWRYRMHLGLDQLAAAGDFNERLRTMIASAGRDCP
jgi:4-alpha-glucanotransferase